MKPRTRTALADARAFGPALIVRALYEASKRFGLHDAVFRPQRGRIFAADVRPPLALPRPATHDVEKDRVQLFGRIFEPPPSWHALVEREGEWPRQKWWRIDIRSGERAADVKWVWELGRLRHVVLLARDVALVPAAHDLVEELTEQCRSWLDENPPELGIHWYSNLEIALRGFAWLQVLDLAGDALPADVHDGLAAQLVQSGRHLLRDLPYTVSSMRNNHLLGDALGFLLFAAAVPAYREAGLWRRLGSRLFAKQLGRQVRADGSMIEDSVSYQRFVIEMLVVRSLLDHDDETRDAMTRATQYLARLGVLEGAVPQIGDWDEGRVLATAADHADLKGSVLAALALSGTGAPEEWREQHDECAWYVPEGEPVPPEPAEIDGHDVGGGTARAQRGHVVAWLKAGSGPSHGHADLCQTPIRIGHHWLIGDPGTGTYNGPIEIRNYFRSSIAHNVLRLDGHDQLEPHRAFRWRHTANGAIGPPLRLGDAVLLWGAHDAYRRLTPGRRVARTVLVTSTQVVAADWVEGPAGIPYSLGFPLAPEASWDGGAIVMGDGSRWSLRVPGHEDGVRVVHGQEEPFDGWWSHTYGSWEPATRLEITGTVDGPVLWDVHATDVVCPVVEDGHVKVGELRVALEWAIDGAMLTATTPTDELTAILRLA